MAGPLIIKARSPSQVPLFLAILEMMALQFETMAHLPFQMQSFPTIVPIIVLVQFTILALLPLHHPALILTPQEIKVEQSSTMARLPFHYQVFQQTAQEITVVQYASSLAAVYFPSRIPPSQAIFQMMVVQFAVMAHLPFRIPR